MQIILQRIIRFFSAPEPSPSSTIIAPLRWVSLTVSVLQIEQPFQIINSALSHINFAFYDFCLKQKWHKKGFALSGLPGRFSSTIYSTVGYAPAATCCLCNDCVQASVIQSCVMDHLMCHHIYRTAWHLKWPQKRVTVTCGAAKEHKAAASTTRRVVTIHFPCSITF